MLPRKTARVLLLDGEDRLLLIRMHDPNVGDASGKVLSALAPVLPHLREAKYIEAERVGAFSGRSTDIGVVLDLMIHDLDLVLSLTRSPVKQVEALGMSVLIGFALLCATRAPGRPLDRWTVFRLFLFPFCVSSYSTLIKGKGFFLIFPTERWPLLAGIGACAALVAFQRGCRAVARLSAGDRAPLPRG